MKFSADALKQQIIAIDAQLTSLQRTSAMQGVDLRREWDSLICERIRLSRQLMNEPDPMSLRRLVFLFSPLAIVSAMILWLRSAYSLTAAAGFAGGLVSMVYFLVSRRKRRSRDWDPMYGWQPELTK